MTAGGSFSSALAASLLVEPPQAGDEELIAALGDHKALPGLQLVGVDQHGEDGHQEAVSHVPDADSLIKFHFSSNHG